MSLPTLLLLTYVISTHQTKKGRKIGYFHFVVFFILLPCLMLGESHAKFINVIKHKCGINCSWPMVMMNYSSMRSKELGQLTNTTDTVVEPKLNFSFLLFLFLCLVINENRLMIVINLLIFLFRSVLKLSGRSEIKFQAKMFAFYFKYIFYDFIAFSA